MAWKGRLNINKPPDFSGLLGILNRTKLQTKDQDLYQLLSQLINKSQQNKDQVNEILQSFFGDIIITDDVDLSAILELLAFISNILKFGTLWTENDEHVNLPASNQAVAGTGITLDYTSVPGTVIISATAGGGSLVPMTTGAYPFEIMGVGQTVMMISHTGV